MSLKSSLFTLLLFLPFLLIAQTYQPEYFQNLNIRNVGPANMSGRITAIDVVERNTRIIYLGAASGGVWKSENGGTAWKSIFDDQPTQNIGALAIQQDNPSIVWVGTGEGNPRNSVNLGQGLYRSLDAGESWELMGLEATKSIHRILVDPQDGDVVYVGAMGDPFTPNEHRGVYKTTDGGESWQKILYTNEQSGVADMVMDPDNPNKIFVAMYNHRRTPYSFTSGGPGSGLFVTYDGGKNWQLLGPEQGLPEGELGRIGIAIAPSNPDRVYAKVEATINALYRSDDGGKTWKMINDNPRFTNNRPFYFQDLAVDSKNPDRLYNIYQPLSVSYDGGESFDPVPMIPADETKGIHADFHAFWVDPNDPDYFIIGGDGGIGITHDKGVSWYFPETIPVAQFYHIAVDNEMPYNVYGGMQDNGNWSGPAYVWKRGGIRTLYWQYLVGGDGFYVSPDSANARYGYGTSQNGDLYRYDKLTGYYQSIQPKTDQDVRLRFNWDAGFARDLRDQDVAYYGSQFLHKSTDRGKTWEIISPDLTNNNPEQQQQDYGGLTIDASGAEFYNSILSIAPSPLDEKVIWVGTDDGNVQLTRDGGDSWQNVSANVKGLPKESWIKQIQASRYKPAEAWMVVNNYRRGDYAPYLYRTTDFGKSWQRMVDAHEVKGYALAVMQDPVEPKLVFLGTENGLWISIDEGQSWVQFENGFPSVSTMDLAIQERESALIVGTFGRAIWVLDDLLSLREAAAGRLKSGLTALPMNDAVQVKGLFINPPGNIWTGFNTTFEGENKPFQQTLIPFYVNQEMVSTAQEAKAEIFDAHGKHIQTVSARELSPGLNYLTWKLDEAASQLPGTYVSDESRGIPVLTGRYRIVVHFEGEKDTTEVQVIPDPRFEPMPEVDAAHYTLLKRLDQSVAGLSDAMNRLSTSQETLENIQQQLNKMDYGADHALREASRKIDAKLKALNDQARGKRPEKQVGAWQSFETTAYGQVSGTLWRLQGRTFEPSSQDEAEVAKAEELVKSFKQSVNAFYNTDWKNYRQQVERAGLSWFGRED
ncbi:MAG: WD40/YVTN/BNR-like repeat-containing protein [Cyclobacteriaceae bacterium]